MDKENFEKNMEDWAENEIKSAPRLRPTAQMYRLVESQKRRGFLFPQFRWSIAGLVLAAVILVVIGYFTLVRSAPVIPGQPVEVAEVPQREVKVSESRLVTLETESPTRGKDKGPDLFQLLDFQVHRGETNTIESLDLRQIPSKPLVLTETDSYRLLVDPRIDSILYLFQQAPSGEFQALYLPDKEVISAGEPDYLPQPPDWFYLLDESGQYQLFVIASPIAIDDLENLYNRYAQIAEPEEAKAARALFQRYLETMAGSTNTEAEFWQLSFSFEPNLG